MSPLGIMQTPDALWQQAEPSDFAPKHWTQELVDELSYTPTPSGYFDVGTGGSQMQTLGGKLGRLGRKWLVDPVTDLGRIMGEWQDTGKLSAQDASEFAGLGMGLGWPGGLPEGATGAGSITRTKLPFTSQLAKFLGEGEIGGTKLSPKTPMSEVWNLLKKKGRTIMNEVQHFGGDDDLLRAYELGTARAPERLYELMAGARPGKFPENTIQKEVFSGPDTFYGDLDSLWLKPSDKGEISEVLLRAPEITSYTAPHFFNEQGAQIPEHFLTYEEQVAEPLLASWYDSRHFYDDYTPDEIRHGMIPRALEETKFPKELGAVVDEMRKVDLGEGSLTRVGDAIRQYRTKTDSIEKVFMDAIDTVDRLAAGRRPKANWKFLRSMLERLKPLEEFPEAEETMQWLKDIYRAMPDRRKVAEVYDRHPETNTLVDIFKPTNTPTEKGILGHRRQSELPVITDKELTPIQQQMVDIKQQVQEFQSPERLTYRDALHLDELQSDWLQQAYRAGGFEGDPKVPVKKAQWRKEADKIKSDLDNDYGMLSPEERESLKDDLDQLRRKISTPPPPEHPYPKEMMDIQLKDFVHDAVQSGKEYVTWTPSDIQIKRNQVTNPKRMVSYKKIYDSEIPKWFKKKLGVTPEKGMVKTQDGEVEVWRVKLPPDALKKISQQPLALAEPTSVWG